MSKKGIISPSESLGTISWEKVEVDFDSIYFKSFPVSLEQYNIIRYLLKSINDKFTATVPFYNNEGLSFHINIQDDHPYWDHGLELGKGTDWFSKNPSYFFQPLEDEEKIIQKIQQKEAERLNELRKKQETDLTVYLSNLGASDEQIDEVVAIYERMLLDQRNALKRQFKLDLREFVNYQMSAIDKHVADEKKDEALRSLPIAAMEVQARSMIDDFKNFFKKYLNPYG